MSRAFVPWSAKDETLLAELWTAGKSFGQIAAQFKCGRGRVSGKIDRMGLMGHGTTPKKKSPGRPRREARLVVARRGGRVGRSPKPKPAPIVRPREVVPPPEALMISLMELTPLTCRWPIGDPGARGFGFCGCRPFQLLPYCEHHAALAYVPVMPRAEREARKLAERIAA